MGIAIASSLLSIFMFVKEEREGKRLKRNVENIVRSMTLDDFIYSEISKAFSKHAPAGYPLMRNFRAGGGTQYFSYYEEDESAMGGVIYAHRNEMNHFAMYDEFEMSDEISNFVNQKMKGGVFENWNELCDEFSTGAQYVVADRGMNPALCQRVWANSDTQTFGLATDPAGTKPDYVVDATILSELVGMTRRERHSRFVGKHPVRHVDFGSCRNLMGLRP